jgi:hypothetical protein
MKGRGKPKKFNLAERKSMLRVSYAFLQSIEHIKPGKLAECK